MHQTFDLFSDLYALRPNTLTRLDPRVKIAGALGLIGGMLVSTEPAMPLAVGTICLAAVAVLRIPFRLLVWRLAPPLAMTAVLCLLRAFLAGGTPVGSVTVAGWTVTMTREGLWEGGLLAARVFGCINVLFLLGLVAPAPEFFAALRWAGMPRVWVETALLMYRYIFALIDNAADMTEVFIQSETFYPTQTQLESAGETAFAFRNGTFDDLQTLFFRNSGNHIGPWYFDDVYLASGQNLDVPPIEEPPAAGDFNFDGVVDRSDYEILRDNLAGHLDGPISVSEGDINFDGQVDLR